MSICPNCGSEIPVNLSNCPTCNEFTGYPNVREAERKEEVKALEKRYQNAIKEAKDNGYSQSLEDFEEALKFSHAVVNVDIDFLYKFVTKEKVSYSSYELQVDAETRIPASWQDDRSRRTVDSMIFGLYAKNIRYAALSLDNRGVKSYGSYAMTIKEIAIRKRSSLLENNSYHFIKKNKISVNQSIPTGHRAVWKERNKLVVSKLYKQISSSTLSEDYAKILLVSKGDRSTDEVIEIHIYGGFDNKAIEAVRGKSSSHNKTEHAMVKTVKEYLNKAGIKWIEK